MHRNINKIYCILTLGALMLLAGVFSVRAQTPGGVNLTSGGYTLDLWVDGDHSNNSSWPNISSAAYSLERFANNAPIVRNSRFNFHQEMFFGNATTNSKLRTTAPYSLLRGDVYYVFMVSDPEGSATDQLLFTFNASGTNTSMRWFNSNAGSALSSHWTTTQRTPNNFSPTTNARYGITTMGVVNSSNGLYDLYLNGVRWASSISTGNNTTGSAQYTVPLIIGNGSNSATTGTTLPMNGGIQEVILIRKSSSTDAMSGTDILKIHSYLAIKYGIDLNNKNDNYIKSDDVVVWNRNTNSGYNDYVFGIGRDNTSGLNQVQSRSVENSSITIFKGTLNALNNNTSNELTNQSFLMLGSNKAKNTAYSKAAGAEFADNKTISEKINYFSSVYKAQVTGTPGNVNVRVNSSNARYVLVSNSATFVQANTRIYPISGQVASNVDIANGEYLTFAGYEASPGGVDLSTYELDIWVDGNHSTVNSWDNLAQSNYVLEQFSSFAPAVRNSRFNFHKELFFGNNANSKLRAPGFLTTAAHSYHIFVVSDAVGTSGNQILYSFSTGATDATANRSSMRWQQGTAANVLSTYWTTTQRNPAFPSSSHMFYGISTLNVVNANSSANNEIWLNGNRGTLFGLATGANTSGASNGQGPLLIGHGNNSATSTTNVQGFNGSMQEIIMIRKTAGSLMGAADLNKIHSYLAIKYGIPLNNGNNGTGNPVVPNYVNSDGITVWDRSANSGYNNNIFGIARDDHSGLYQRQARSSEYIPLVMHVGSLSGLNSENSGTLDDKQYLLIGRSDDGSPIKALDSEINSGDEYQGEFLESDVGFNIQSAIYKSQITGPLDSMTVKMTAPSGDFSYALVSTHNLFDNVGARKTKIYPVNIVTREVEIFLGVDTNSDDYKFIKFIGFAPGPGGVSDGLLLWLKADDDASIKTIGVDMDATGSRVAGYPGVVADRSNVPGVAEWHDYVRNQVYSYTDGWTTGTQNMHRYPVLVHSSMEMNYYPAVHFYSNGSGTTGYSSWLGNAKGISPIARPAEHTALFMVNNNFSNNAWVYALMFGSATGNAQSTQNFRGPGYGIHQLPTYTGGNAQYSNNVVGRLRTSPDGSGNYGARENLFSPGSTSILSYGVTYGGNSTSPNNRVLFRFNGLEDYGVRFASSSQTAAPSSPVVNFFTHDTDGFNLSVGSQLGRGYDHNRTIQGYMSEVIFYDKLLPDSSRMKIESYMAIKYGVTLRPSNVTSGRFDYTLSSGQYKDIWLGNSGDPQYATFYNRIAALVRDDAAHLNNRHTHSTNVGSLLHLGVAGSALSNSGQDDPNLGSLENLESVAFGDNGLEGFAEVDDKETCGGFDYRFNRIWLIHKNTTRSTEYPDGRPIKILIGAQNNTASTIGMDSTTYDYYNALNSPGSNVYMIVGESPEKIAAAEYLRVIPMAFINKEFQCNYELSEIDTYITFGYRDLGEGCVGEDEFVFPGVKTFQWTQWTSQTNRSNATGLTITRPEFDLGDNIKVTGTSINFGTNIAYPNGTRATVGYPRSGTSPERGSLQVRRQGGNVGQAGEVTIEINFNTPVIPSFAITDLDAPSTSYEQVEIYGECEGNTYNPTLSYASARPTYKISGRMATVERRGNVAPTSKDGRVEVAFRGGVTKIVIKYRMTRARTTTANDIYITPITVRMVPPPPPINEDGFSFVKDANKRDFLTCEPVTYTFEIQNTNCEEKPIYFSDKLPEYMRWELGSFGLDAKSDSINALGDTFNPVVSDAVNGSGDQRVLKIDSLILPGATTLKLTAVAVFDDDAPSAYYDNSAMIDYMRIKNSKLEPHNLGSVDKYDVENPNTTISVTWAPRPAPILSEVKVNPESYRENGTIDVTWIISNTNGTVEDLFLNVVYNEEFSYVAGSFEAKWLDEDMAGETVPFMVIPVSTDPPGPVLGTFDIVGKADGSEGFNLLTGDLVIKFKLKAPIREGLVYELDESGVATENVVDLIIMSNNYTLMEDVCLVEALKTLDFEKFVPYGSARSAIITNRNVTTVIKK